MYFTGDQVYVYRNAVYYQGTVLSATGKRVRVEYRTGRSTHEATVPAAYIRTELPPGYMPGQRIPREHRPGCRLEPGQLRSIVPTIEG